MVREYIESKMKGRMCGDDYQEFDRYFSLSNRFEIFKNNSFACIEIWDDCYFINMFYADKPREAYRLYLDLMLELRDKPILFTTKYIDLFQNHAIRTGEFYTLRRD